MKGVRRDTRKYLERNDNGTVHMETAARELK